MMNSLKMIYTIARYYNTTERMTGLMCRISNQLIHACCDTLLLPDATGAEAASSSSDDAQPARVKRSRGRRKKRNPLASQILWQLPAASMVKRLQAALTMNEVYQNAYQKTKAKMAQMPSGENVPDERTGHF